MRLWNWIKSRSRQEMAMVAIILMILFILSTRWSYTTNVAGEAFRRRFVPPTEQSDSLDVVNSMVVVDSISD